MPREFIPHAEHFSEHYRKSRPELYDPVSGEYKCRYGCEWRNNNLIKTTNHESHSLGARRRGEPGKKCPPPRPAYFNIPGLA